ncbi:MAG: hypothetical protein V3V25_12335 [Paracoccaceae bacterium]
MEWMTMKTVLTVGVGAFVCGVALFYLVMQRTRKHRAEEVGAK